MPLTYTAIQNAKGEGKTRRLSDERGLYLEISPKGGKWWRLKYRFNGKEKRLSLGVFPDVSLKEASANGARHHASCWRMVSTRAKTARPQKSARL